LLLVSDKKDVLLLLLFSKLNVLFLRLVLLVSKKNYGFLLQLVHLLSVKVAILLIFYSPSAVLMEIPFEIQQGNIPALSSHPVINKSTIFGQKLKVKNTIHHK
jgi:hypothetical protein